MSIGKRIAHLFLFTAPPFVLLIVFVQMGLLPDFMIRFFNRVLVALIDSLAEMPLWIFLALALILTGSLILAVQFGSWWGSFFETFDSWKIKRARNRRSKNGLVLGLTADRRKPLFISNNQRAEHILVLGSTGTGKTTTVLEPAIFSDIMAGRQMIFITAKEEPDFVQRLFGYAAQANRLADLRFFSLSNSSPSHSFNPLLDGDPASLRDLLMEAFTWDNTYYRDQSKSALFYVLTAMRETGRLLTLRDLYYAFTEKGCLEILSEMVKNPEVKHHLRSYSGDWNHFREDVKGLAANLEDYTTPQLRGRLCQTGADIQLVEAYKKGRILIFVLNSLQYGETARRLGRLIIQNIRYLSGLINSRVKHRPLVPVYIDEFHHFVYPEFFSMIAQCRSANISVTLSTQSFSDLKGSGWDITSQVIQNTNTKIIFRQNDADSADLTARLAGTRTVDRITEQVEKRLLFGQTKTGLGSLKSEEEFIIHPNQIRTLPFGQAACLIQGEARLIRSYPVDRRTNSHFDFAQIQSIEKDSSKKENSLDLYNRWVARREEEKGQGIRRPRIRKKEGGEIEQP